MAAGVRRVEERPGQAAEGSGDGEQPAAPRGVRPDIRQADPAGGGAGKLLSNPLLRCVRAHAREGGASIGNDKENRTIGPRRVTRVNSALGSPTQPISGDNPVR